MIWPNDISFEAFQKKKRLLVVRSTYRCAVCSGLDI